MDNKKPFRLIAAFLIGFFLVMTLLTAFVAIPQINKSFQDQHLRDSQMTLAIETELLKRFVANHRTILEDLSSFPIVTNTALLSSTTDPNFIDLVDNFAINGQKSRLIFHDIAGNIIYQTATEIDGDFSKNAPWIKTLLDGAADYNFQLLTQEGDDFRFVISVPITYRGYVEGILSAQITTPLETVFSPQTIGEGEGFKLHQNDVTVTTDLSGIVLPKTVSTSLVEKNMELVYISDERKMLVEQDRLRNTILLVLFAGLGISFLLFVFLGFRSLTEEEAQVSQSHISSVIYMMPIAIGILGVAVSIIAALLLNNLLEQQGQQSSPFPWVVLLSGSVFSGLITYTFIQLVRSKAVIEEIVRKRTQELRDSEAKTQAIVDNTVDGLITIDERGHIESFNKACETIFGYQADEAIGQNIKILMPEPYEQEHDGYLKNYRDTGDRKIIGIGREVKGQHKDGRVFPIELSVNEVSIHGRRVFSGIVRDITERKKSEAEREEFRDAMENTVEGVSQIDPQGRYIYLNEAYAGACGYKPSELVGKNWQITVHEGDHEMMEKSYQAMLDTGQVTDELRGVRKNGSIFYKRVTMISRYDDNSEFIGHHCFMSDISERKKAENELIRSNRDLNDFAYIASHDLKEPLRGIHNYAGLLQDEYEEQLDDDARHKLNRMMYLTKRMEQLISDLLYYSRLGRSEEKTQEVNLNEIVADVKSMFLDDDQVSIEIRDQLPTITCDRLRVEELFRNLITNGIKYNEAEQKRIEVGIKNAALDSSDRYITFYISDNGIGIAPRFHQDIFKIFKRLHRKDAYGGGTGSGLTFVQKIIERQDGQIWVESELGEGSTFFFTLPINHKEG